MSIKKKSFLFLFFYIIITTSGEEYVFEPWLAVVFFWETSQADWVFIELKRMFQGTSKSTNWAMSKGKSPSHSLYSANHITRPMNKNKLSRLESRGYITDIVNNISIWGQNRVFLGNSSYNWNRVSFEDNILQVLFSSKHQSTATSKGFQVPNYRG